MVTSMTVFEVEGAPKLELPEEPLPSRWGCGMHCSPGKNWRDGFSDDICIGLWLWSRWQPALEPGRVRREDFVDVVMPTRRELWLWLLGDRQW